jgi:hypothetical protein
MYSRWRRRRRMKKKKKKKKKFALPAYVIE